MAGKHLSPRKRRAILISILGCVLLISGSIPAPVNASTVTIDVDSTVNEIISSQRVGIGLNWWFDDITAPNYVHAMRELKVKAIRNLDGTFDLNSPAKFRATVLDPDHWAAWRWNQKTGYPQYQKGTFDDFITTTRAIGAEPIWVIATTPLHYDGPGKPLTRKQLLDAAVACVTYCNITKKWGVTYFEIGNEPYSQGCNTTEEFIAYGNFVKDVSTAMKAVDPSIRIGVAMKGTNMIKTVTPLCKDHVDWFADHSYGYWAKDWTRFSAHPDWGSSGDVRNDLKDARANGLDVPLWITEFNNGKSNQAWNGIFTAEIGLNHLYAGADAVIFWTSIWGGNSGNSAFYKDKPVTYKKSDVIGHVLQCLNDGWQGDRVVYKKVSGNNHVKAFAMYDAAAKGMTLYLINRHGSNSDKCMVTLKNYTGSKTNTVATITASGPQATSVNYASETAVTVTGGTFTITLPKVSITAIKFAAGSSGPGLEISRSNLNLNASGGKQEITVTSNTTWTVTGNRDWISLNPDKGSGNGTVSITVSENSGTTVRTGTVTISGGGITREVSVSQAAPSVPVPQSAFNGPHILPGTLQAEDFDNGGEGVAYHDNEPENRCGSLYRPEKVDVKDIGDARAVCWNETGEWREYTVTLPNGTYDITVMTAAIKSMIAAPHDSARMTLLLGDGPDGGSFDTLGTMNIAPTEGWDNFKECTLRAVSVTNGGENKVLRLETTVGLFDIDRIVFAQANATILHLPTISPETVQSTPFAAYDLRGRLILRPGISAMPRKNRGGSGIYIMRDLKNRLTGAKKEMLGDNR